MTRIRENKKHRKLKKCAKKSAFCIKASLTIMGIAGLGLMLYDFKNNRECDVHVFTTYAAFVMSSITIIAAVGKFGHEIYKQINCFEYLYESSDDEAIRVISDEEITSINGGVRPHYNSPSGSPV